MVEEAEALLGRPVLTSNQAMSWLLRRQLGISAPLVGFGRLLSGRDGDGERPPLKALSGSAAAT